MAGSSMVKALGLALGAHRIDGETPMATCPDCGEPLISSMVWPYYEFVCGGCGLLVDFVSPKPAKVTPELEARLEELRAGYDAAEDKSEWREAIVARR